MGNPRRGASGRTLSSTFHIEVLSVWASVEQVDALGHLRPFFPRPLAQATMGLGMGWARLTLPSTDQSFTGAPWASLGTTGAARDTSPAFPTTSTRCPPSYPTPFLSASSCHSSPLPPPTALPLPQLLRRPPPFSPSHGMRMNPLLPHPTHMSPPPPALRRHQPSPLGMAITQGPWSHLAPALILPRRKTAPLSLWRPRPCSARRSGRALWLARQRSRSKSRAARSSRGRTLWGL